MSKCAAKWVLIFLTVLIFTVSFHFANADVNCNKLFDPTFSNESEVQLTEAEKKLNLFHAIQSGYEDGIQALLEQDSRNWIQNFLRRYEKLFRVLHRQMLPIKFKELLESAEFVLSRKTGSAHIFFLDGAKSLPYDQTAKDFRLPDDLASFGEGQVYDGMGISYVRQTEGFIKGPNSGMSLAQVIMESDPITHAQIRKFQMELHDMYEKGILVDFRMLLEPNSFFEVTSVKTNQKMTVLFPGFGQEDWVLMELPTGVLGIWDRLLNRIVGRTQRYENLQVVISNQGTLYNREGSEFLLDLSAPL